MKRLALVLMLLAACREEEAALPAAVPMTAESTGYFCQMDILGHPGPKAQVHLDGTPGVPLFFSQVRDAVTYLRLPEQSGKVLATYVSDMGAAPSWDDPGVNNWILADKAVYVVGSDVTGGMDAPEVVPFGDPAKAEAFAQEHGGQVMALDDIPDDALTADPGAGAAPAEDADYTNRLRALTQQPGG